MDYKYFCKFCDRRFCVRSVYLGCVNLCSPYVGYCWLWDLVFPWDSQLPPPPPGVLAVLEDSI